MQPNNIHVLHYSTSNKSASITAIPLSTFSNPPEKTFHDQRNADFVESPSSINEKPYVKIIFSSLFDVSPSSDC